jgi:hypothetical protein
VVNNQAAISMKMADILVPQGQPWTRIVDPSTVVTQACNRCHEASPPGNDKTLTQIINPFGTFKSVQGPNDGKLVQVASLVINTTEPTKGPILTQIPPAAGITRQTLAAICTTLNNQTSSANKNLCTNLKDYQSSRSCGAVANTTCGGVNGGGLFQNSQFGGDNSLSAISFDVSGQARKGTATYTFLDTEGSLTAYNYQSRKLISSVKIVPAATLAVTPGANFAVSGTADAQISTGGGAPAAMQIQFVITMRNGTLSFMIFDTTVDANFLAGGTGQNGASVTLTNLN